MPWAEPLLHALSRSLFCCTGSCRIRQHPDEFWIPMPNAHAHIQLFHECQSVMYCLCLGLKPAFKNFRDTGRVLCLLHVQSHCRQSCPVSGHQRGLWYTWGCCALSAKEPVPSISTVAPLASRVLKLSRSVAPPTPRAATLLCLVPCPSVLLTTIGTSMTFTNVPVLELSCGSVFVFVFVSVSMCRPSLHRDFSKRFLISSKT